MQEFLTSLLPLVSFIVVACLVYAGGRVARRLLGKQKWWRDTKETHPIVVGGLLGLIPWPVPQAMLAAMGDGHNMLARVLFFAAAGLVSQHVYGYIHRRAKRLTDG